MFDLIALGELLIDFTADRTDPAVYTAHPGGAPANYLAAAAAVGARTAMLAKVGDDQFGDFLCRSLAKAGVETAGVVRDASVFTTLAFVGVDEAGERSFSFSRKPGADTCLRFEEVGPILSEGARILHFGSLSLTDEPARSATVRAVASARGRGGLITFDPNYRPLLWRSPEAAKEAMLWGLAQADVVKLSEEEAGFLYGEPCADAAARILRENRCGLVFVTLGKNGAYYATRRACGTVGIPQGIRAADTTGAGDIFFGTAAALLLREGDPPEALDRERLERICRFACTAASLSTQRSGGLSSVPDFEQVKNFFSQNYGNGAATVL